MLTRVGGLRVGHATDAEALTGCTVVICDEPMVGGVDIRGSNTATRDTPRLRPVSASQQVHGIVLSGGSGFGLNATAGVADYLERNGIGMRVDGNCLPVVAGCVLYDLDVGSPAVRPDFGMGLAACENATSGEFPRGNVGAGTGATIGKFFGTSRCTKGGIGTCSQTFAGGLVVGALAAVNAFGDVLSPAGDSVLAGVRDDRGSRYVGTLSLMKQGLQSTYWSAGEPRNTTIGIVATNARLTPEQVTKVAEMAHAGYARAINPVHSLFDGDVIFSLARIDSDVTCDVSVAGALAADTMQRAIVDAVTSAQSVGPIRRYDDFTPR
jgi:L-aminopeptidase/D-esterase-like protein